MLEFSLFRGTVEFWRVGVERWGLVDGVDGKRGVLVVNDAGVIWWVLRIGRLSMSHLV